MIANTCQTNGNKDSIQPVLVDLKKGLKALYGKQLKEVILFGSYARGEATSNSDIDILVLLNKETVSKFQEIKNMEDVIFDILEHHHQLIGVVPVGKMDWETATSPLFRVVRKEGISL